MIAELICVGTELLMGQVTNTNARFIASALAPSGIDLFHQIVVGDNPARLTEAIQTALSRADVLILSGGLGPTDDDLTKETVAAAFGVSLELYPDEWTKIEAFFAAHGKEATPNNRKQAMFPNPCIILPNPNGTAPGCILERDGKAAILLPGPPRELEPMFADYAMPYLLKQSGHALYSRELRIFGMGESEVTHRIDDLIKAQTNPTIAPYAKTGEVTLRITARCASASEGEALVLPMIQSIRDRLGDVVYSDAGEPLPLVIHNALCARHNTLSVAESCTGGLLSSAFVDLAGSSDYFLEGDVTYSNAAKLRSLGVPEAVLNTVGAVSEACAAAMAEGIRARTGSTYGLATTGIAGPGGGTAEKPVGTVFVALAAPDGTTVKQLRLWGDRTRIRELTVLHILDIFRRKLFT